MKKLLLFLVLFLTAPLAVADIGVGAGVGTLGFNVTGTYHFNDFVSLGVGLNRYSDSRNANYKGINYNATLRFSSEDLLVNLYPFAGSFRFTGGWMHNGNTLSMAGMPDQNGNFTFNGNTYSAQQAGTVTAGMGFNSNATYLGIGWGGNGSWGLTLDLGVVSQGTPKFNLDASGSAVNPQLANDVNQQRTTVQNDVDSFTWYPQVAVGFYFRF
ncbi:MAG: hypothetical protein ACRETQ_01060 [Gammaproteobacteria bacterium]